MPTPLDVVRQRLLTFGTQEAKAESPLYAHLAEAAAGDDEVAALLTGPEPERARATLFFAAAHRLVLAEPVSDVAHYYPSVGGEYGVDNDTWPVFRRFVLERADEMRALIDARTTQTNEVRRAALLYPAIARAAKQAGGPVGLLEVGTSAGLLLGMDKYGYRYQGPEGEQLVAGPAKTAVVLNCALSLAPAAKRPTLPRKLAVAAKVGLDRRPVDVADEEQLAWLEACVWPDQPERVRLLNMAAAAQARDKPEFVTGDLVDDLAAAAARVPAELPLVVFNSHVLPYVSAERQEDFVAALGELAAHRPLWWVCQEAYAAGLKYVLPERAELVSGDDRSLGALGLTRWVNGKPEAELLARTAFHGERIEWLAS